MLTRMTILAGLALVLLAGCGSDDEGGGGGSEPAATLAGPVTYERGGGIAGRRDRLVVQPDGSAELTVREKTTQVTVPDKDLATLARDLESAELASLPRNSTTKPPVPDTFALPRELRRQHGHHRRSGHARPARRPRHAPRRAGREAREGLAE